ncbi:MAG TPA: class I SAM-dependent methyltransferase [Acidimicrobiales bacterium]|nr:class I SAM-dependent methyltransferase [Acidimicrobiales bacterium]
MAKLRLVLGRRSNAPSAQLGHKDAADLFTSTTIAPSTEISPLERMDPEVPEVYFAVGESALRAIRMAQVAAGVEDFSSILDFPSGHGRVLRWLQAAYPKARLSACDLLTDGVDFCVETFGAEAIYSTEIPSPDLFSRRYDLIWVGSLLTHVDVDRWDLLIRLWNDLLEPNGLLVVTTHGPQVAASMRRGFLYGYPEPGIERLLRSYESFGFGFLEDNPATCTYGITVCTPSWAIDRLLSHGDFNLVLASEAMWSKHQDVIAVVKGTRSLPWANADAR